MAKRVLTPKRLLVLIAALLVLMSLLPGRVATAIASPPREVLAAVTLPVSVPLKVVSTALRRPETGLALDDEHHPGQGLKYRAQLEQELERLRQENRMLRQARDIVGDQAAVRLVSARVGSASTGDGVQPTLTIDRGRRHGVEAGQAVVWGFILVGQVSRAGPVTSDVGLVTAADTGLEARIVPPTRSAPARQWRGWVAYDRRQGALIAELDDPEQEVEAGDVAHLADISWPSPAQGFVLGRVETVQRDPGQPYLIRHAIIRPLMPLEALTQVSVLVEEPRHDDGGTGR